MIDWIQWQESPELRKSVQILLADWGRAYRGGWPDLGYPDHQPWTTPPQRDPAPPYDAEQAHQTEQAIRAMVAEFGHHKAGKLLVWRYVHGIGPDGLVSRYNREWQCNDSRGQVLARLDQAEWTVANLM